MNHPSYLYKDKLIAYFNTWVGGGKERRVSLFIWQEVAAQCCFLEADQLCTLHHLMVYRCHRSMHDWISVVLGSGLLSLECLQVRFGDKFAHTPYQVHIQIPHLVIPPVI